MALPPKRPIFDVKAKKGQDYTKYKIAGKKKIVCSSFVVLMNTNFKPRDKAQIDDYMQRYPEILESTINSNPDMMQKCFFVVDNIVAGPHNKQFFTHAISDEEYGDIKYVKSRFEGEVGLDFKRGGRFHLHCSFFVVHTSKLQMELKPLVDKYNEDLAAEGYPPIKYYHVKAEKPSTTSYMKKYYYASLSESESPQ
jgi:hypothetical protein